MHKFLVEFAGVYCKVFVIATYDPQLYHYTIVDYESALSQSPNVKLSL